MIITYRKITSVVLFLCSLEFSAQSQSVTEFADRLYQEGDYHDAVTEYKRAAFFSSIDSVLSYCNERIALAYFKSHEYNLALRFTSFSLQQSKPTRKTSLFLVSGLSFYEQNMPQLALPYFESWINYQPISPRPWTYKALAQFKVKQYEEANQSIDSAIAYEQNIARRSLIEVLRNHMHSINTVELKSPATAMILSLVLPGAGQYYSKHVYDGLQAFLYTATAALATYSIYKYETSVHGKLGWTYVGISITSLFHLANILSAKRTAEYRNMLVLKQFNDQLYTDCKSIYPF